MLIFVIKDNTNNNYRNNLNYFIGDINNNKVGILREKLKTKIKQGWNFSNTYFSMYSHFHKMWHLLLVTNTVDFG